MSSSPISRAPSVEAVIRSAHRRWILTHAAEESALAFALVFGGVILLLLAGTQILHWRWLILLGGIGLGLAAVRVSHRRLNSYRIAQLLDRRMHLSDSLSTAWFLCSGAGRDEDRVAQLQIARAEELAPSVRVAEAFPFTGRRAWAITGALVAVAFGLFAVRYLVTNSLSLRQSLIPIHFESVFERWQNSHSAKADPASPSTRTQGKGSVFDSPQGENTRPNTAATVQDANENGADATAGSSLAASTGAQAGQTSQEGRSETREGENSGSAPKSGSKAAGPISQDGSQQNSSPSDPLSSTHLDAPPGLMDKMKDAFSSLIAKMRQGENSPASAKNKERQNGDHTNTDGSSPSRNSATKSQTGQQGNAANQQGSPEGNSAEQAQGQTTEKAQASPGQNSDQSPQSGSDAHSGIGRQDGDKDIKEAGQLRAVGKLEEIIGKRSANLTGEMTVETPANKQQQLQTAYSQRQGRHSDAGGEINRNEIPLAYQQYVREYMEQVRKGGKRGQ